MGEKTTPAQSPPDSRPSDDPTASPAPPAPDVKDHITRQLRALYDEVANQPVPDRFMELLNRLDAQSQDE